MRSTARAPGTLRVVAPSRSASARAALARSRPVFELAISRQGLGVELSSSYALGPVRVTHLRADLPGLKFPIDVTGGLARFRSHRSSLNLLRLECDLDALSTVLGAASGGTLGKGAHRIQLRGKGDHLVVCVSLARETSWDDQSSPVLVFEVFPLIEGGHLSLGISAARGHALLRPARELALALMSQWTSSYAERIGGSFAFSNIAREICTDLFVSSGMRAPRVPAAGLSFDARDKTLAVSVDTLNIDSAPSERAAGVSEHLRMLLSVDDALATGREEIARMALVEVLCQAPRHVEASQALASIDALYTHRWEASLMTLAEADVGSTSGTLMAELYQRRGEREHAARAACLVATHEPQAELAARALAMAASLEHDSLMVPMWLEEMVTLAPSWARGRILRMRERLRQGDLLGAQGDAQHAEASVRGSKPRFEMCLALGHIFTNAGYASEAGAYYERALTYVPEDAQALGALGGSLIARGLRKRGLQLLREAVDRGERNLQDMAQSRILLSRAIAEATGDLSTAVSLLRGIADSSAHAIEARSAEARLLESLNEHAAASIAWSRFAHLAQGRGNLDAIVALRDAVRFERDVRKDAATTRHLARIGLSMVPGDSAFLEAFAGGMPSLQASSAAVPTLEIAAPVASTAITVSTQVVSTGDATEPVHSANNAKPKAFADLDEGEATQRVEDLSVDLRRNPNDADVVAELVHHLTRLSRSMDLLALLSARLEEADPQTRRSYLPDTIRVYRELAKHARSSDVAFEAELYESAAQMLSDELARD